ncbi:MAG: flagellar hook-basal body protein [Arcobacteraceae bacterium]
MNSNYPLAAAMINQLNRVDMISNNLANANTNGYKQTSMSEGTFNNYLTKAHNHSELVTRLNTVNNTVPKLDTKFTNEELGSIVQTGNALDFALKHKDTFFKVQNTNGEVILTRDGSFKIVDNILVTSENLPVLSTENEPIEVEAGEEFTNLIGVARASFTNIEKIGNNNYRAINQEEVENLEEDNTLYMLNGTLEKSNVNAVNTMVALIDAHRRFEQSQKAIQSLGDMTTTLIEKLGNNR